MPEQSLEREMLNCVANYSPVSYLMLNSRFNDWLDCEVEYENFSSARQNLAKLGLIVAPDYGLT